MAIPLKVTNLVFNAAAADATTTLKSLNTEFPKALSIILDIKTTAFSGTLDFQGRESASQTMQNLGWQIIDNEASASLAVTNNQISYTTDTANYRVLIPLASSDTQIVMTRTAGSITITATGVGEKLQSPFSSGVRLSDDVELGLGTGSPAVLLWETADANANVALLALPEGGATDVPVFAVGDASAKNVDLGMFDGLTEPMLAVIDDDQDSYIGLTYSGDDAAILKMRLGSGGTVRNHTIPDVASDTFMTLGAAQTVTGIITHNADLIVSDGSGVLVGNATRVTGASAMETQLLGTAEADSVALLGRWSADAAAPGVDFVKSRNATIGSFTIVNDNDVVGALRWFPDDGVDYATEAASFHAEVDDGSAAAGDVGMAFVWKHMAGGGAALAESMRLSASGILQFGSGQEFGIQRTSATQWKFLFGAATILDFLETTSTNAVREWRFWNSVASTGADQSPIINMYNDKAGEVAFRMNHADDDTGSGALLSNPWVIHIPPSLVAGDFHLNITRDGLGNYMSFDSNGKVSVGFAIGNTTNGIARFAVVGGEDDVQAIIKGHSTQTNNIFDVQKSDATSLLKVDNANVIISGELNVGDGADGNPSINFASSTTTGLRFIGAGQVGVEANLRVDMSLALGMNASGTAGYFDLVNGGAIRLGGTAAHVTTTGTNYLSIFDGTAPVGTLANGVSLYSAAGELYAIDAAGNTTLNSPHNKLGEWIFYSRNTETAREITVNMEQFFQWVDETFGTHWFHENKSL